MRSLLLLLLLLFLLLLLPPPPLLTHTYTFCTGHHRRGESAKRKRDRERTENDCAVEPAYKWTGFFFFAWLCLSLGMPSKKIAIAAHTKSVKNTGTFQKPVCPDLSCRLSPKVSVFVAPFCLEQNTKRKLVFHHNCSCSACRASRPAQSH